MITILTAGVIGIIIITAIFMNYLGFSSAAMAALFLAIVIIPYIIVKCEKYNLSHRKRCITFVLTMVIALLMGGTLYYGTRDTEVSINDESIEIRGIFNTEIPIKNITGVYLKDSIPKIIVKTNGFDFGNILKGNFKLQGLGEGGLYIYQGSQPYVYINENGKYVIINYKETSKTTELYDSLKQNISK